MRRPLLTIASIVLTAVALALPSSALAASDAEAAALKRCPTPRDFMTGPFFADQVRARGVSCRTARALVKRWGRTRDCVSPRGGPDDDVCRVGRYRCVTRQIGYETLRARCTRGKRRAVGFRFGS